MTSMQLNAFPALAIVALFAATAPVAAQAPVVIKASGLAAGKGVIVCETIEQADHAIQDMLVGGVFGVAGREILVEEFMAGEELSVLAITDGERVLPLVPAQDHKRLCDGDRGPNTGGMGAYAPVSLASEVLMRTIIDRVYEPTLAALRARGSAFTGVLYAGLMLTSDGPRVVEFNCRFGDPETQAVLPRLRSDLVDLCRAAREPGGLAGIRAEFTEDWAVTVVLATAGGLAVWLLRRKREVPAEEKQPQPEVTPAAVEVHCPQCGKTSKARAEPAGRNRSTAG